MMGADVLGAVEDMMCVVKPFATLIGVCAIAGIVRTMLRK
jgi:hypothetical protein